MSCVERRIGVDQAVWKLFSMERDLFYVYQNWIVMVLATKLRGTLNKAAIKLSEQKINLMERQG